MKTYGIVQDTEVIKRDVTGKFRLFGVGNEKRDMVLLVRGDIKIERPVCVSFFGCLECGYMDPGAKGFDRNGRKEIVCVRCKTVGQVYYFDGVWKDVEVEIETGVKDDKITICKV